MQKQSRKLNKKEKITLLVVLVAIVVGMGAWRWYLQQRAADRAAYELTQKKEFAMDEAIHLDAARDESTVNTQSAFDTEGVPYMVGLPWSGSMDLRVQSAKLYDTPAAAGVSEGDLTLKSPPGSAFLIVGIDLKNVDAAPTSASRSGRNWFNISFIRLPPQADIPFFNGAPPDADSAEILSFDLAQGEEKEYLLGCFVDPDDAGQPFDTLVLGGVNDAIEKYSVKLKVQDMRGGGAQ